MRQFLAPALCPSIGFCVFVLLLLLVVSAYSIGLHKLAPSNAIPTKCVIDNMGERSYVLVPSCTRITPGRGRDRNADMRFVASGCQMNSAVTVSNHTRGLEHCTRNSTLLDRSAHGAGELARQAARHGPDSGSPRSQVRRLRARAAHHQRRGELAVSDTGIPVALLLFFSRCRLLSAGVAPRLLPATAWPIYTELLPASCGALGWCSVLLFTGFARSRLYPFPVASSREPAGRIDFGNVVARPMLRRRLLIDLALLLAFRNRRRATSST